jgi:hypothetical protein
VLTRSWRLIQRARSGKPKPPAGYVPSAAAVRRDERQLIPPRSRYRDRDAATWFACRGAVLSDSGERPVESSAITTAGTCSQLRSADQNANRPSDLTNPTLAVLHGSMARSILKTNLEKPGGRFPATIARWTPPLHATIALARFDVYHDAANLLSTRRSSP